MRNLTSRAPHLARTGLLLLAAALSASFGCAILDMKMKDFDPMQRRNNFEQAQHKFTTLVRWGHIDDASRYVIAEQRADFMSLAPGLVDLRFTDYEIIEIDMAEDYQTAVVDIRYRGYRLSQPVERTVDLQQKWHRDPLDGDWTVEVELDTIRKGLGMPAR